VNPEQLEREDMRWRILRCLECSGIHLMRELYIWRVLNDLEFFSSIESLRVELDYLEKKGLVNNVRKQKPLGHEWMSSLTAVGTDYVQYVSPDIPGVARPPQQ
jgi:hypothetical protein